MTDNCVGLVEVKYRIKCNKCGTKTDWFKTEKAASAAWEHIKCIASKENKDTPTAEEFWGNK